MPWGKVDDTFYDHDKVLELPAALRNEACGLYFRLISYCNAKLTDGVVTDGVIDLLGGRAEVVEALRKARLLSKQTRGGNRIHDFLDFNKSRAEVESERERKAAAGRLGGIRSGEARRKQDRTKREPKPKQVLGVRLNSESESESTTESTTPPNPPRRRGGRKNGVVTNPLTSYDSVAIRDPESEAPDWLERAPARGRR